MEVILKWCSKSVFIYHKVAKKTKARFLFSLLLCGLFFLQAALYLILTIQLPVFGNLKTFILRIQSFHNIRGRTYFFKFQNIN